MNGKRPMLFEDSIGLITCGRRVLQSGGDELQRCRGRPKVPLVLWNDVKRKEREQTRRTMVAFRLVGTFASHPTSPNNTTQTTSIRVYGLHM